MRCGFRLSRRGVLGAIAAASTLRPAVLCVLMLIAVQPLAAEPTSSGPMRNAKVAPGVALNKDFLKVQLGVEKAVLQPSDSIYVEVSLANASSSNFYIYGDIEWGENASLSLSITNKATKQYVDDTYIPDAPAPPPNSSDSFSLLRPGSAQKLILNVKLSELNITKEGKYRLVVSYHSPIPAALSFGLPVIALESGTIYSNPIDIMVK